MKEIIKDGYPGYNCPYCDEFTYSVGKFEGQYYCPKCKRSFFPNDITYEDYHKKVVGALMEIMEEEMDGQYDPVSWREFWDKTNSYEESYYEGISPEECARNCRESL